MNGRFQTIVVFQNYQVAFVYEGGMTVIAEFSVLGGIHEALEAADNLTARLNTALFREKQNG